MSEFTEEKGKESSNTNSTIGAAYSNSDEVSSGGISIMPPENQFSTQPLESGGSLSNGNVQRPQTGDDKEKIWTTPKEKEQISSKSQAIKKLWNVKVHINFLIDMATEVPDLIKKPESLGDLKTLAEECIEVMGIINADPSEGSELNPADAEILNAMSPEIEYSYDDVFSVLAIQAQNASRKVGAIPDMKGLDGSLKELIRSTYGEKNQSELDKIMNTLEGTAEYHRLVNLLQSTSLRVVREVGSLLWAEGLERVEKPLKSVLESFKSNADYVISFISGLIEVFGSDPSHPTEGMRKTFDLIDTIINNPFTKVTPLTPLWTAYKPAIDFCMNGIDMIKKQRDEQFNLIGISRGLVRFVKEGNKDQINQGMVLGLPGASERGKLELLHFMMDVHTIKLNAGIEDLEAPPSVKDYFMDNIDLINAGDGTDRVDVDYGIPIYSGDDDFSNLTFNVWEYRFTIWSMLYGSMLTPPGK